MQEELTSAKRYRVEKLREDEEEEEEEETEGGATRVEVSNMDKVKRKFNMTKIKATMFASTAQLASEIKTVGNLSTNGQINAQGPGMMWVAARNRVLRKCQATVYISVNRYHIANGDLNIVIVRRRGTGPIEAPSFLKGTVSEDGTMYRAQSYPQRENVLWETTLALPPDPIGYEYTVNAAFGRIGKMREGEGIVAFASFRRTGAVQEAQDTDSWGVRISIIGLVY